MNLIVAIDDDYGIGLNGDLIYHISADLKYFKKLTTGKVVVMGKATYLSLPKKPLPNRVNIVLSSTCKELEGAILCKNTQELFNRLNQYNTNDVFVIGGASVYKSLLPYCSYAYITKIHKSTKADTYFENIDKLKNWSLIENNAPQSENGTFFEFCVYKNANPLPITSLNQNTGINK